jgi:hypothetical protein
MGEVRPRWAKLPPAERDRRLAQSAADRARDRGPGAPAPLLPEGERRHRQSQSAAARSRAERWADLSEDERRRRQSQSDGARAAAAHEAALPEAERRRRQANRAEARRAPQPVRGSAAEVTELESHETLQAMWNTVENGGYDFMTKDDW